MDEGGARPIRTFVAVALGGPAHAALARCLEELRATGAAIAWARPANLHLTLAFLGEVAPDRIAELRRRLAPVAAAQAPFTIGVRGCGAFPTLRRPRALWVAVHAPPLAPLASAVDAACVAAGFERERRTFRPHVTLGRVRGGGRPAADAATQDAIARVVALRETDFGTAPAAALTLFRSELGPAGARHTPLAVWPFVALD